MTEPEKYGETYSAFIKDQADAEYDRRASLDARGTALVTTSGVLVTLVFAAATFALGRDYVPSIFGRAVLAGGLFLFLGSAVFGLIASALRYYDVTKSAHLKASTREHWRDSEEVARRNMAYRNAETVATLRKGNESKATLLTIGLALQVAALLALVTAVIGELFVGVR